MTHFDRGVKEPPKVRPGMKTFLIEGVELKTDMPKYGAPGEVEDRILMTLKILEPRDETQSIPCWCSTSTSPKARFGAIARAVLGGDIPKGGFDDEDLVNRQFGAFARPNTAGWPTIEPETVVPVDDEPSF